MAIKPLPDQATLLKLFRYDPDTGKLFWRARPVSSFQSGIINAEKRAAMWNGKHAGTEAFTANDGCGYRVGTLYGRRYLAHRIIAKMHGMGEPPQIDHINGHRSDNRLENLRCATATVNRRNQGRSANNKHGVFGVYFKKATGKWVAQASEGRRAVHLGTFQSVDEAKARRLKYQQENGYHPNHGTRAPR